MARDMERYVEACNLTNPIDEAAVESHLREYLRALGINRNVCRIRRGWKIDDYPDLAKTVDEIIVDAQKRAKRNFISSAPAGERQKFAAWCLNFGGYGYLGWEFSWLSTTYFGAQELKKPEVTRWSRPVLEAFIAGCQYVYWTEKTLYWIAIPTVHLDERRRLHRLNGPALISDNFDMYFINGVIVPKKWVLAPETIDPVEVIKLENVDLRAIGAQIAGWPKMIKHLKRKIIDGDPDTDVGALIELTLPGLPSPGRFLQAICPRNGTIVEGVPRVSDIDNKPIDTVMAAQAWRAGKPKAEYQHPLYRT